MKPGLASQPRLRIFPDPERLAGALAARLVEVAGAAVQARGLFRLVLNGGGTPQPLFELLGSATFASADFWPFTEVYWGDERCVPPGQAGSNYRQARLAFLDRAAVPEAGIFRIPGEIPPEAAAAAYRRVLAAQAGPQGGWPTFDLVLLGLGTDGHTASLFPGSPLADDGDAVLAVTADYAGRPAERVTLTEHVFNSARAIWWMAAGRSKSQIVTEVLFGSRDPERLPAQRIDPAGLISTWWLDEGSAGLIVQR